MTVRVSVNYNDPRWKRCDLKRYGTLLLSKVFQTQQMRLNNSSLSVLACNDSKIKELNQAFHEKCEKNSKTNQGGSYRRILAIKYKKPKTRGDKNFNRRKKK